MIQSGTAEATSSQSVSIGGYREFYNYVDAISNSTPHDLQLNVLYFELDIEKKLLETIKGITISSDFSNYLLTTKTQNDMVFKIEPQKYVIIVSEILKKDAIIFANRIKHTFETKSDSLYNIHKSVTVSVGLSIAHTSINFNDIVRHADKALYLSKNQSASMLVFWE